LDTFEVEAPNSLLLIGDIGGGTLPPHVTGLVSVGRGVIAVGTLMSQTAPTTVRIQTEPSSDDAGSGLLTAFRGSLDVPGGVLVVSNVYGQPYRKITVPALMVPLLVASGGTSLVALAGYHLFALATGIAWKASEPLPPPAAGPRAS